MILRGYSTTAVRQSGFGGHFLDDGEGPCVRYTTYMLTSASQGIIINDLTGFTLPVEFDTGLLRALVPQLPLVGNFADIRPQGPQQ